MGSQKMLDRIKVAIPLAILVAVAFTHVWLLSAVLLVVWLIWTAELVTAAAYAHMRVPLNWQEIISASMLFGITTVGLLVISIVRNKPGGVWILLIFIVSIVVADTAAYKVGSRLKDEGKPTRPLSKHSGNKTREGAIAGVGFGYATMVVLGTIHILSGATPQVYPLAWAIVALVVPVVSIYGDLFESAVKRNFEVKDLNKIVKLGEHGGIPERVDSQLPAIVLLYVLWPLIVI